MTLDDIKTLALSRSDRLEICDTTFDVAAAATEEELIKAALPDVIYAYQSGIVDDALLAEFDQANLNAVGIYSDGVFTLDDPEGEIFIMTGATVTVNMTGINKCRINAMGSCNLTLNISDNAGVSLVGYNGAVINLTLNDNARCNYEGSDESEATIECNDDSRLHIKCNGTSTATLTANDDSYAQAAMYVNSGLTYTVNNDAEVVAKKYQNATLNQKIPPP